ncbi:Abi family protein [Helcococcus bovis]|uniref:Abi family protein n=1 Tax=Helcococcus bovis TaxID=3153252 RepID=UPI0038BB1CB0
MKEFKTIDEQIKILKDRDLLFDNEEDARNKLFRYGYYEIVNGYKDFILKETDKFIEGETFEHLFSLFTLDMNLQKEIMDATKRFELIVKTALAYHLSDKYGHLESNYLKRTNFKSGHRVNGIFQIDQLLNTFNKVINDDNEPFNHYKINQHHTPAWILFKGVTLGSLKNFYKLQKSDIKEKVIRTVLGIPISTDVDEDIKNLFSTILYLSHKFRNRAAHNGRIFSYNPRYNDSPFISNFHNNIHITREMFNSGYGKNDLYTFINYLKVLDELNIFAASKVGIEFYINKHLSIYPKDKQLLFENMGVPEEVISNYNKSKTIF